MSAALTTNDLVYIRRLMRAGAVSAAAKIYAGAMDCGQSQALLAVKTIYSQIAPSSDTKAKRGKPPLPE